MAKKPTITPPAYDLQKQSQAATLLMEQMKMIVGDNPDDQQLVLDMVEGETKLFEVMDSALELIGQDILHIDALKARETMLAERRERKKHRIETLRLAIQNAMEIVGIREKHEFAICTVTPKAVPAKLMITDESAIPARFFVQFPPPPPALDNKAVLEYLKARETALNEADGKKGDERTAAFKAAEAAYPSLTGAELSNGNETIQITWK